MANVLMSSNPVCNAWPTKNVQSRLIAIFNTSKFVASCSLANNCMIPKHQAAFFSIYMLVPRPLYQARRVALQVQSPASFRDRPADNYIQLKLS